MSSADETGHPLGYVVPSLITKVWSETRTEVIYWRERGRERGEMRGQCDYRAIDCHQCGQCPLGVL